MYGLVFHLQFKVWSSIVFALEGCVHGIVFDIGFIVFDIGPKPKP